jgi:hypothetical protein
MLGIPAFGRLRQEDCKFKTSVGYRARPCLKKIKISWAWWSIPMVPAMQEVEVEGLQYKASLGKSARPYLKIAKAKKGWRRGSSGRALETSMRH